MVRIECSLKGNGEDEGLVERKREEDDEEKLGIERRRREEERNAGDVKY